jgi:hypothetical protein
MPLHTETGEVIGVIETDASERPGEKLLFQFSALSNDRFSVKHPFHGPFTVGDQSTFSDHVGDATASLLMSRLSYLADSRKLNRTRRFETRPNASEFSQLSHCISLGVIAVEFGGGVMDVLDALLNDAPHAYDGHQADDNYQGHGKETLHDYMRPRFLKRVGFMNAMVEADALRPNSSGFHVGKTRLHINSILDEEEVTVRRSFLSNKHKSRRMDADRFQYNTEETLIGGWAVHAASKDPGLVPLALAQRSLESVSRMIVLDDDEGDQMVFDDPNVALASAIQYVNHNVEHWCEPVQDLVNDLLNLAERYFFVCDHDVAREMQYFYPRDYLHASADLMMRRFDAVAKDDVVMAWLLNTAESIASDQRQKSLLTMTGKRLYVGPDPIAGVTLKKQLAVPGEPAFGIDEDNFYIDLPKGKVRTIDPRVLSAGTPIALSAIPRIGTEYTDYSKEHSQWIGDYKAWISIEDPATRNILAQALLQIQELWPSALRRVSMPDNVLQAVVQEANTYVLEPKRRASFV